MFGGGLSEADKARARAGELVTLANGAQGTYRNGRWVLVKGADAAYMNRIRASRGKKPLSQKSAQRAFNRYYKQRDYKTERARKAAVSRDKNFSPRNAARVTDTTRYLRNPGRLDYPGIDAGERRSANKGNYAAGLEAWRAAHPKGSPQAKISRRSGKAVRRSIKRGGSRRQQEQQGGRAVSLKTAVKLLRSYYSQRYGRQQ